MKDQDPKITNIKFQKVYLSDLNAVIRIYQKMSKEPVTKQLTGHFGFPLSIAIDNNEVIGFAFASVNEMEQVVLNSHYIKEIDDLSIINKLEAKAESVLYATFEHLKEDHTPLKNSIQQLVEWLNICAN